MCLNIKNIIIFTEYLTGNGREPRGRLADALPLAQHEAVRREGVAQVVYLVDDHRQPRQRGLVVQRQAQRGGGRVLVGAHVDVARPRLARLP